MIKFLEFIFTMSTTLTEDPLCTLRFINEEMTQNFLEMTCKLGNVEKHIKTSYSFIKHLLLQL